MLRRPCLALIVAALAIAVSVPMWAGQDQAIESVFRSGVEIVRGRIMQNGRGRAPRQLVKEDFEIKQNGVVQPIDVFEVFVLSPTRICYEIGFSSTTPASVKTRTVEIKIRGYSKRIKSTYTLMEEGGSPPDPKPLRTEESCRAGAGTKLLDDLGSLHRFRDRLAAKPRPITEVARELGCAPGDMVIGKVERSESYPTADGTFLFPESLVRVTEDVTIVSGAARPETMVKVHES